MATTIQYYPASASNKRAITLVAHGLNVQPEVMLPLITWLCSYQSDVFLVKLSGHYAESVSMKDVTTTLWQQEMLLGYQQAYKAAKDQALPLYFVGYSLGALLGQVLLTEIKNRSCFDKQVLLAPATAIRDRSYLIKLLFFLGKRFPLPSYTPTGYRYNKRLPLSIYHILFSEEKKIRDAAFSGLNIPTLLVIDPKDELISYKKLLHFIDNHQLTNYQVLTLDSDLKVRQSKYHHLIINEHTIGAANWELVTSRMKAFLFNL